MTAPGNSALVFTLLAVFLACSGYAAGRLHQRYQTDRDREEAYRDGYDTATRSIFSLAARLVGPRRGGRSTPRPVLDGSLVTSLGPSLGTEPPTLPAAEALSAAAALSDHALADSSLSDPSLSGSTASSSSHAAPMSSYAAPLLPGAGPLSPGGGPFSPATGPLLPATPPLSPAAASAPEPPRPPFPTLGSTSPSATPGSAGLLRHSAVPGAAPKSSPRHAPAPPENDAPSLGFPVPPRPSPRILGEPAAFGGVVYRPFPDPRLVGSSEPMPADRGSPRIPRPTQPEPVLPPESTPDRDEAGLGSTGRHMVPEELVQAETYRLPADRVFRARVPEPAERPALPEESTTRLSVPKPRKS